MKAHVENLINFQIEKKVITKRDYVYVKNQLYNLLNLEFDNHDNKAIKIKYPSDALEPILDKLEKLEVLNGSQVERDLFDSKIMNIFTSKPSVIQNKFDELASTNNSKATKFIYNYVTNINYIRKDRVDKNIAFTRPSKYGFLEITINLSKPEKDPKSIALAGKQTSITYPKCVLCKENEGFSGNYKRDSRNQHRLIEFDLLGEDWFFQYSPYTYYNEHTIVFSGTHKAMSINDDTFPRLLALTDKFDGYFFGSNADLPIVGGSILSHEHYQGGRHVFPIEKATKLYEIDSGCVQIELLNWPLSTIRIKSENKDKLAKQASLILHAWKNYSNEELNIKSHSKDVPHHTITPIARKNSDLYELDLILRNNQTSNKHPMGIYHPHADKWHIKKENIGLIEAIGLAILPGRLKAELQDIKNHLIKGTKLQEENLKHKQWIESFRKIVTKENVDEVINTQLALVFEKILEDSGVFKLNEKGIKAFKAFIDEVINNEK